MEVGVNDDRVSLAMSSPLDSDGFLYRECPICEREFKWLHTPEGDATGETPSDRWQAGPLTVGPRPAWTNRDPAARSSARRPTSNSVPVRRLRRAFVGPGPDPLRSYLRDGSDSKSWCHPSPVRA